MDAIHQIRDLFGGTLFFGLLNKTQVVELVPYLV
jgi:hypothetical protein